MAKPRFESVDAYLAAQPEAARAVLERVRGILKKALPRAEECISYQIPAYRLPGGVAVYFAGWKEHFSLYPASRELVAALGDALGPYAVAKGTIRFPLDRPVPVRLVARIAKLRASEVGGRAAPDTARRGGASVRSGHGSPRAGSRTKRAG